MSSLINFAFACAGVWHHNHITFVIDEEFQSWDSFNTEFKSFSIVYNYELSLLTNKTVNPQGSALFFLTT